MMEYVIYSRSEYGDWRLYCNVQCWTETQASEIAQGISRYLLDAYVRIQANPKTDYCKIFRNNLQEGLSDD